MHRTITMLSVFGTLALDTTRTPFRTETKILGGAATFASVAASLFTKTGIVAVAGGDLPEEYLSALQTKGVDTQGVVIKKEGRTFHFDSSFDYDLSVRTTLRTELNVIADFDPVIPKEYSRSEYVYLANNDPKQNLKILKLFESPKLVVCDTIEFWINGSREDVIKMISSCNGVVINDNEARLLCKEANISKCAKKLLSFGPSFAVIKKGEHGAILFDNSGMVFPTAAYFLDDIMDPTGAGDSFAGGFVGHIASQGKFDFGTMKEAVIYGNVLGSFAVEEFGVGRLLEITKEDVARRYAQYKQLVQF